MKNVNKRWALIAWAPYGRRSESLARELKADLYFIHYLKFQRPIYAPAKYILQAIRTSQVLFQQRPNVVLVQNPPFVCGLVVYLYCRIFGTHFMFDHHSAAFARIWNWALPLQRFLSRQAITNLVTNEHWADIIRSWSASAFILIDPLTAISSQVAEFQVTSGFNIVFINTFADDELLEIVLMAAERLPTIQFYITGNTNRKPASFFENTPPNVTFTGFLPDIQYFALLKAVQAVMTLTTRDYTLQGGGFEAISLGQPLLTSNWPYLQKLFPQGTIYVDNTPDGICAGVMAVQQDHQRLEEEMETFRDNARHLWEAQLAQLNNLVNQALSTTN